MSSGSKTQLKVGHIANGQSLKDLGRKAVAQSPALSLAEPLLPDGAVYLLGRVPADARPEAVRQQLYYILDYYILAEQGVVTYACHLIEREVLGTGLSETAKAGARAVARQELIHSRRFAELRARVEVATGVRAPDYEPIFLDKADQMLAATNEPSAFCVLFAAITEVYPSTLAPLLRTTIGVEPFVKQVFLDHEDEEILHRAYWWNLLEELWSVLTPVLQRELLAAIPAMLACHLMHDEASANVMLSLCGVDSSSITQPSSAAPATDTIRAVARGLVRHRVLSPDAQDNLVQLVMQELSGVGGRT